MADKPSSHPIKAGEALMRAIEDDPAQQAKLEAFLHHNKQKWQDLAGDLGENMESARDLVEDLFRFRPTTIEDWEYVAGIVKMPFENLRSGDLTLQEIYDAVGHWAIEVVARKRLEMEEEKGGVYPPAAGDQEPEPINKSVEQALWWAKAASLVQEHPEWPEEKIAREVGKHPSTLSRNKIYQAAATMARGDKSDRRRGHITVDPDSGQQDVEAYSDDPEEEEQDLDD